MDTNISLICSQRCFFPSYSLQEGTGGGTYLWDRSLKVLWEGAYVHMKLSASKFNNYCVSSGKNFGNRTYTSEPACRLHVKERQHLLLSNFKALSVGLSENWTWAHCPIVFHPTNLANQLLIIVIMCCTHCQSFCQVPCIHLHYHFLPMLVHHQE